MDRYYDMRRIVDRFADTKGAAFVAHFTALTPDQFHLVQRGTSPELMAEFARSFIYEVRELNEMDLRLRQADVCFANAARHHGQAQPDLVAPELAKGVAYLRIAADAWRNIVDGYAFARRAAKRNDGTVGDYERGALKLLADIDLIASHLPSADVL